MSLGVDQFTLTEDHIKLLRNSYVSWFDCEYGAAAIDPKRPYGNSGEYEWQIARLLGLKPAITKVDLGDVYSDAQEDYCRKVHQETQTALQVVLATGEFTPGVYECRKYGKDWKFLRSIVPEKASDE